MKIEWTKRISEDIVEIMKVRPIAAMVNYIVSNNIKDKMDVSEKLEELRKHATAMHEDLKEYSVDQIIMTLIIEALISQQFADEKDLKYMFMDLIASEARVLDDKEFMENPYVKNIKLGDMGDNKTPGKKVYGDMIPGSEIMKPYEMFLYDTAKRDDERLLDILRLGCFTSEVSYPAIIDRNIGRSIMAITPYEINTMDKAVRMASGKVLLLGCGMGYFAYMASRKSDVESVTVIEKNQDIIDIMEQEILPQFEYKDKVKIVKADAYEFIKGLEDGEYDYCFVDIWNSTDDVAPYLAIKDAMKSMTRTRAVYRLEEAFAAAISQYVWIEILKAFTAIHNLSIPEQVSVDRYSDEEEKRKVAYIHTLLEDAEIKTPEHIDYYMNPGNIIKMIEDSKVKY